MITYKNITLEDRGWMMERLRASDFRGSEYCFANQFLWGKVLGMEAADVEGCLCTRYPRQGDTVTHDFPAGNGDRERTVRLILEDDRENGCVTVLRGMLEPEKDWLEQIFPGKFQICDKRAEWDYLYSVEALGRLSGKKYHGKRNHIARFQKNGSWSYEELNGDNMQECIQMYYDWLVQNRERLDDSAQREKVVVEGSFGLWRELGLQGGLLRQEGRVVAFCVGEPLNSDTYIVHLEKAYPQVQGAYPMINQQFVLHVMEGFAYVNREDDMGLEGLRKAKLSYHPELLLEKYSARLLEI